VILGCERFGRVDLGCGKGLRCIWEGEKGLGLWKVCHRG